MIFNKIISNSLVRYFLLACIIVSIELGVFQLIYTSSKEYIAATFISFVVGVALNWFLGRKLVFGKSIHSTKKEFALILGTSVVGIILQLSIITIGIEFLSLYPLISKIFAIGISFFWNYWYRIMIIYPR